jgi:hypothetical protein
MLNVAVIFLSADLINIQNRKRSGWFILSISMNIGMRLERNKNNNKQNKQTNKTKTTNKQQQHILTMYPTKTLINTACVHFN